MPTLSDYVVANERTRLHRRGPLELDFATPRRQSGSPALLDIEMLGGTLPGQRRMRVRLILNGAAISTPIVDRWDRQGRCSFTRRNVTIPPGTLRDGENRLVLEPRFESAGDYMLLGTVAVHFRQAV